MTKHELIVFGPIKKYARYVTTCVEYNKAYQLFLKDLENEDNYKKLLTLREELKKMSENIYDLHHG